MGVAQERTQVRFAVNGGPVLVQFYLMETLEEGRLKEKRYPEWLSLDKALARATHPQTCELIALAEQKRIALMTGKRYVANVN